MPRHRPSRHGAIALDARGKVLYEGRLVFALQGMFGSLFVESGHPASFDWYAQIGADVPPPAAVASYISDCVGNPNPPV